MTIEMDIMEFTFGYSSKFSPISWVIINSGVGAWLLMQLGLFTVGVPRKKKTA
jgi:hypothetical protein